MKHTHFMKYLCPLGVLLISHPGGNGVLSSNASLPNEGARLCWFAFAFRTAEKDAGDERVLEWETVKPPSFGSGGLNVLLLCSRGGCLKKDGGSFRILIGSELEFCSTLTGFITCVKSRSSSFSESCRTWTITLLLVFLSIVFYKCPV